MLYCTATWCGIVAWWCAVGGLLVGLAAAGAWIWSTRAPWDPLGGTRTRSCRRIPSCSSGN